MKSYSGSANVNRLDPEAYLRQMLSLISDHPITRIEELPPRNLVTGVPA